MLRARRKLGAIATNEYHSVLEVNENPSLWVDPSSQESSSALPGVTSSLLVSIKDDELEMEGEESLNDAEDGGHKNDKVNSMSALMGDASRDDVRKEVHEILKRGFPCSSHGQYESTWISIGSHTFKYFGGPRWRDVSTLLMGCWQLEEQTEVIAENDRKCLLE